MIGGIILFVVGGLIFLTSKFGLPFGRLPGDIRIQNGSFSCFFPVVSMIVISILLSLVLNIVIRLLNR